MSNINKYSLAFILALSLHFSIIGLFAFNFISEPTPTPQVQEKVPEIIEASILDENIVAEKAKELQQAEEKRLNQRQQQKDRFAKQLKQEKLRIEQAKTKRLKVEKAAKVEAKRLQQVAKNEAKKLAAIKQAVVLEKQKKIAKEKAQAVEKKRKQELERVAEEQRKVAAEKKEVARKEAEKQQKIAQEKQRQEKLVRQKEAAAKQAEESRVRAQNARIAKKAMADAKVLIKRKIMQNWNQPSAIPDGLSCTIRVNLIPSTGDVMLVNVEKSSGNRLFDESAERAALKASTLPVPKDPKIAQQFRSFVLLFDPNNQ